MTDESGVARSPEDFVTHGELSRIQEHAALLAIKQTADALEEAVSDLKKYITELEGSHSK